MSRQAWVMKKEMVHAETRRGLLVAAYRLAGEVVMA